ncbi:MFS general substrate transporter [Annulohypoxylon bovei var. microspora]|nr:MFS general substrate transporter [Annulohypoxylon bovei var. microspora]
MASSPSKVDATTDNTEISDHGDNVGITQDQPLPGANSELEKAVIRKIDLWLVGFYSLVYIFRVIDSANYSNAAIINLEHGTGIKKQLGLSPSQWAWTLSIFSYSYMIFEPTNTLAMKVFSPSRWMFVLILGWGISACSSSTAQDFKGMMCVRFAIGVAEAGFFPAVLYHMAFWYKPREMPQRIAIFYSVGQLSPATARMLTDKERVLLQDRLAETAPTGRKGHWDFESLRKLFRDPTFYTFSVYWICHGIGGFGVGTALPTVIYELGFTTTSNSQLMNIPPYVSAFLFLNTTAVAIESTIIVCYIVLFTVRNAVARYIFLIVAVSCAGSAYPVIWPERIRTLEGTVASGPGIGWTNAMAQFSGIAGPHVFSTAFGPTYHVSYGICLGFLSVGIAAIFTSWLLVWRKDQETLAEQAREGVETV